MLIGQLEAGALTEKEVIDETIMFYMVRREPGEAGSTHGRQAGHETTTSTLNFAMFELAQNPDVVDKMYHEVLDVCGPEGDITWDHVHELKSCYARRAWSCSWRQVH